MGYDKATIFEIELMGNIFFRPASVKMGGSSRGPICSVVTEITSTSVPQYPYHSQWMVGKIYKFWYSYCSTVVAHEVTEVVS